MGTTTFRSQPRHTAILLAGILGLFAPVSDALQFVPLANNTSPVANPDAWGKVPVPGFNLAEPYPGSPVQWGLELNITKNGTSYNFPTFADNTTMISLRLVPPAPGSPGAVLHPNGSWALNDTDAPDSWHVTMISWTPHPFKVTDDENDLEDGSCPASAISEDCVQAIRNSLIENPSSWAPNGTFPLLSMPRACRDSNGPFWTTMKSAFTMDQNFTKNSIIGLDFPNELDNYNNYGGRTFILVTVWAPSNSTAGPDGLGSDHITVSCVKADQAREPGLFPDSAAVRAVAGLELAWSVVALAGLVGVMVAA